MISHGLSFDEYRAIPALNNSGMKHLERSPLHYQHWLNNPDEEESDALRIGKLAHEAILEPCKFAAQKDSFAIKPDGMSFATKEGKQWRDVARATGKQIVTPDEHEILFGSVDRIKAHPLASQMLGDPTGKSEVTLCSELEGVPVKCRLDWMPGNPNADTLPDLKTCEDASERGFQKAVTDRRYYRQAAFYLDICRSLNLPFKNFAFLALEKSAPFAIGCYLLDDDAIAQGRAEYVRLLRLYADCAHSGNWPGYSTELKTISLPYWKLKEVA